MSECVVRMEKVPKNCDDGCWGSLSGECPWCDSIDGYKMVGNRPPNCPIIAVLPEGHGRLVDADEIQREMYHGAFETDTDMQKWDSGCWIRYKMFENTIGDVPTIVPAERSET